MANLQLPPPEAFNTLNQPHNLATQWKDWASRFTRFVIASGINNAKQQRELLLYIGGTHITDAVKELGDTGKTLDDLIAAFDEHFASRHNPVFARFQFRHCTQQEGESIDIWHQRLLRAAKGCDFEQQHDRLIRDQIVAGCLSDRLRRKLLQKRDVSLTDALQQARVLEAAELQSAEMAATNKQSVCHIQSRQRYSGKCLRCGELGHRTCDAAKGKTCSNCHKTGHLAKACLSKRHRVHACTAVQSLSAASQDSGSSDEVFCLTDASEKLPLADATINGKSVRVLIDNGATCNVIDSRTLDRIGVSRSQLAVTTQRIRSFGAREPMQTLGVTVAAIEVNGTRQAVEFVVVAEPATTVIGRRTSERLGVLRVGPKTQQEQRKQHSTPAWHTLDIAVTSPKRNIHIVTVTDRGSHFPIAVSVRNPSASSVTRQLQRLFSTFGLPTAVSCSSDAAFCTFAFRQFLKKIGVQQLTQALSSKSPAASELEKAVTTAVRNAADWRSELQDRLTLLRSVRHPDTGQTPAERLFGRQVRY
jgi:predicted aspartyl protease